MYLMGPYDSALQEILDNGVSRTNKRTGVKTRSVFGMIRRYRLDTPFFPIVTRRKVWPKAVFAELLWFLSGSSNNRDLQALGCNFWTPWEDRAFEAKNGYVEGAFGPVYGFQLRHFGAEYGSGADEPSERVCRQVPKEFGGMENSWSTKPGRKYGAGGVDQLRAVIDRVKEDPSCRRTLWSLWNPADLDKSRLPPCHLLYQVLVDDDRRLTGVMYQRSADYPVGSVANVQFYSTLTIMIAQQTDCMAHELVHVTADSHAYENQIEAVKEYLATPVIDSPKLTIAKAPDILEYTTDSFKLSAFKSGPKIDIPVAV